MKKILPILFILSISQLWSVTHPQLENFPETEEGMSQSFIVLEKKDSEEEYQLELIVGKTVITDVINIKKLTGRVLEASVKGWGYTYYVAERGNVITTMMAPRRGEEPQERFIAMPGKMIRYNSKLPVVIHHPEDMEVRYRIWRAGEVRNASAQR